MKKCTIILSNTFIIGLKKQSYKRIENKRTQMYITLEDNEKCITPLLDTGNNKINS